MCHLYARRGCALQDARSDLYPNPITSVYRWLILRRTVAPWLIYPLISIVTPYIRDSQYLFYQWTIWYSMAPFYPGLISCIGDSILPTPTC